MEEVFRQDTLIRVQIPCFLSTAKVAERGILCIGTLPYAILLLQDNKHSSARVVLSVIQGRIVRIY